MNTHPVWLHGRMYEGQTVVVLGQGPSLKAKDVAYIDDKFPVVAIKDAFRLASYARIIFALDKDWWKRTWLKDDGIRQHNALRVTVDYSKLDLSMIPEMHYLAYTGQYGFNFKDGCVNTGQNTGHACLNFVVNTGARKIILIGYDMTAIVNPVTKEVKTHFDGCPHVPVPVEVFPMFRNNMHDAAPKLKDKVEVVNCCANSALTCFPKMSVDEAVVWGSR